MATMKSFKFESKEDRQHRLKMEKRYHKKYTLKRYEGDDALRLVNNITKRIHSALKGTEKAAKTLDLLGCSADFLYFWLRSQLNDGGCLKEKQLDHVRACASFNLLDPSQQYECFSYKNVMPLSPEANRRKGCKRDIQLEQRHRAKADTFRIMKFGIITVAISEWF